MDRPHILCASRGSLVLYVGSNDPPRDDEWDAYIAATRDAGHEGFARVLVYAEGGVPTPLQRRRMSELAAIVPHASVVITGNVAARGVVTVLGWLGANVRSFSPNDEARAFAQLEMTPSEATWARATRDRLLHELRASSSSIAHGA